MSYKDFLVRFIDVSKWQDILETLFKPTFELVLKAGFLGVVIKVGYGLVLDRMFAWFWKVARGVIARKPYWYLDYYSHRGTGTTNREWGIEQANVCFDALKADMGEMPLALDCEPSPYGGKITYLFPWTIKEFNEVARGFADEWYRLTGKKCEIYCSPGFLPLLWDWAKPLNLWLAWYSRAKTLADLHAEMKKYGFTGQLVGWQYASDGDIDDDGDADGIELGMESDLLDLNVFPGTVEEWSIYCGMNTGTNTPLPEEEEPDDTPLPTVSEMIIANAGGLNVRVAPINVKGTTVIGWKPNGAKVSVIEVQRVGPDTWARTNTYEWCAIEYNGTTFMT